MRFAARHPRTDADSHAERGFDLVCGRFSAKLDSYQRPGDAAAVTQYPAVPRTGRDALGRGGYQRRGSADWGRYCAGDSAWEWHSLLQIWIVESEMQALKWLCDRVWVDFVVSV